MQADLRAKKEVLLIQALRERIFMSVAVREKTVKSIPSKVLEEILTSPELVATLVEAFTHESYDYGRSYERLEKMGDLIANVLIANRIEELYPGLNPEQLTNILSHYKSNETFAKIISDNLADFDKLIFIKNTELTPKIYADVFEAFIRAVYVTTNTVQPGIGFACCENVFKIMTRDFQFEKKYTEGNPKSVVLEMFDDENVSEYPKKKGNFEGFVRVTISQRGIDAVNKVMNQRTATIDVDVLTTEGTGVDRPTATTNAYRAMLKKLLTDYKLTPEIYENQKRKNVIRSFPGWKQVEQRQLDLKEDLFFEKKKSSVKGMYDWRLIAHNTSSGTKRLVGIKTVTKSSEEYHKAKMSLLQKYLE